MSDLLLQIGHYVVDVWLVPVTVWTLATGTVLLALDRTPAAADLKLAIARTLAAAAPALLLLHLVPLPGADGVTSAAPVTITLPEVAALSSGGTGSSLSLLHLVGAIALGCIAVALWRAAQLAVEGVRTHRMRSAGRSASAHELPAASLRGVPVRFVPGSQPATYGVLAPFVVLPPDLGDDPTRLRLVLEHEMQHVCNRDPRAHLIDLLLLLPFAAHPLAHYLLERLSAYREMRCDAQVLRSASELRAEYARTLLHFARPSAPRALAVGIVDTSQLTERIHAMKATAHTLPATIKYLGGSALLALLLLVTACTDTSEPTATSEISAPDAAQTAAEPQQDPMPQLLPSTQEGLAQLQQEIVYPQAARTQGVEGRVFVAFIVDKEGQVVDPSIKKGLGGELDAEALRAVKTLRFAPATKDGKPVPAEMVLPISFQLPDDA